MEQKTKYDKDFIYMIVKIQRFFRNIKRKKEKLQEIETKTDDNEVGIMFQNYQAEQQVRNQNYQKFRRLLNNKKGQIIKLEQKLSVIAQRFLKHRTLQKLFYIVETQEIEQKKSKYKNYKTKQIFEERDQDNQQDSQIYYQQEQQEQNQKKEEKLNQSQQKTNNTANEQQNLRDYQSQEKDQNSNQDNQNQKNKDQQDKQIKQTNQNKLHQEKAQNDQVSDHPADKQSNAEEEYNSGYETFEEYETVDLFQNKEFAEIQKNQLVKNKELIYKPQNQELNNQQEQKQTSQTSKNSQDQQKQSNNEQQNLKNQFQGEEKQKNQSNKVSRKNSREIKNDQNQEGNINSQEHSIQIQNQQQVSEVHQKQKINPFFEKQSQQQSLDQSGNQNYILNIQKSENNDKNFIQNQLKKQSNENSSFASRKESFQSRIEHSNFDKNESSFSSQFYSERPPARMQNRQEESQQNNNAYKSLEFDQENYENEYEDDFTNDNSQIFSTKQSDSSENRNFLKEKSKIIDILDQQQSYQKIKSEKSLKKRKQKSLTSRKNNSQNQSNLFNKSFGDLKKSYDESNFKKIKWQKKYFPKEAYNSLIMSSSINKLNYKKQQSDQSIGFRNFNFHQNQKSVYQPLKSYKFISQGFSPKQIIHKSKVQLKATQLLQLSMYDNNFRHISEKLQKYKQFQDQKRNQSRQLLSFYRNEQQNPMERQQFQVIKSEFMTLQPKQMAKQNQKKLQELNHSYSSRWQQSIMKNQHDIQSTFTQDSQFPKIKLYRIRRLDYNKDFRNKTFYSGQQFGYKIVKSADWKTTQFSQKEQILDFRISQDKNISSSRYQDTQSQDNLDMSNQMKQSNQQEQQCKSNYSSEIEENF